MAKMGKKRKKESSGVKETEEAVNTVESKRPAKAKRSSKVKVKGKKNKAKSAKQKSKSQRSVEKTLPERPEDDVNSSETESTDREPVEDQAERSESVNESPNVPLDSYVSELTQGGCSESEASENASATDFVAAEQLSLGIAGTEPEESPEQVARRQLKSVIESLVFVSDKPISVAQIRKTARARTAEVTSILKELVEDYQDRGIELVEVAGGYVFRSAPQSARFVRDFVAQKPVRLSQAQLETLSIVAYRQPVTRPEIEEIRGVDTGSAIKVLLDRGLLKMLGRKDEPGRPLLYGTTPYFLEFFGMKNLKDLPTLREFSDLNEENRELFKRKTGESLENVQNALFDSSAPPDLDGNGFEQNSDIEDGEDSGTPEASGDAEVREDIVEEETDELTSDLVDDPADQISEFAPSEPISDGEVREDVAVEEIQEPIAAPAEQLTEQESAFEPLTDQEAKFADEMSPEPLDDLQKESEQERVGVDYDDV